MGNATFEVTEQNFEAEVGESEMPVLVDFWAEWCAPCRMLSPVVEEIASEYEGRAKVAKVDLDENEELARRFGIRSIPTLIVFRNGEVMEQMVGVKSKKELSEVLDSALKD